MHRDVPRIEKTDLLERLGAGHGARITVLTPNRRLAQVLAREFHAAQACKGLKSWETADVLPWEAFLGRLWDDALFSGEAAGLPLLLAPSQEQALWEEVLRGSRYAKELFALAPAAAQCREAWALAQAWRIPLDARRIPDEDGKAFLEWSAHYERHTREARQVEGARLPDVLVALLEREDLRKPATLVLHGFDLPTPQMREFLAALGQSGCEIVETAPAAHKVQAARVEASDPRMEMEHAARWARARLAAACEAGRSVRIGVVVPDLGKARRAVQRTFAAVMQPGLPLAAAPTPLPFNVSLGAALDEHALVADALLLVDLCGPRIAFEHASRLLRSPFIAGAGEELHARARLDAHWRRHCAPEVTLDSLLRQCKAPTAPPVPIFVDRFRRLADFRKASLFEAQPASQWARAFSDALRVVGFPGEGALDSNEQQTLEKWHELLAELAGLERVVPKMGYHAARGRLRQLARDTIFQPKAADVPIQVMGVLESAGQEFDHLWVMGLNDDAWPLPARPNPFIPVAAQRAAGIPQADPAACLELDRRLTQRWLASSPEVVVSHVRMRKEAELSPSALIASLPATRIEDLGIDRVASLREAIRATGFVEAIEDGRAPAVKDLARKGGTGLFKDQAACPFRAFAARRLRSEGLEAPRPGLDARDRGTLVHEVLAAVWNRLGSLARLLEQGEAQLDELLAECAEAAVARMKARHPDALSGRYAALERERLVRLARDWLAVERARPGFTVARTEDERQVTFGGVTVTARLDRRDALAAGGDVVIDYKTGACKTAAWMGSRMDEPQLPMYALGGEDAAQVVAVAFAQVRTGEMRFKGVSRVANLVTRDVGTIDKDRKGRDLYRGWPELLQAWRSELDRIGAAFAAGDARVDPKSVTQSCGLCEQHALCRIDEKTPFGAAQAEGDADE